MSVKTQSRSNQVDLEDCIDKVGGNRFDLILIASARAREITQNNHNSERIEHRHSPVSALLEIQEKKIGREYLRKLR
jgi:DNA-directed RNA polymerase omega subunit